MGTPETYVAVRGDSSGPTSRMQGQRAYPRSGDVLAVQPTARADVYAISVVPTEAKIVARRYDDAMNKVRELARALAVDGWYTCDHTHFLRVASHR